MKTKTCTLERVMNKLIPWFCLLFVLFLQLMTLYCKSTSYPGFCITVTCYYSSALERVINVNLSVCNLFPQSSLFVTSVWGSVCFLLCCRWVMRSFACASKVSLWTGSLSATWSPASKTSENLPVRLEDLSQVRKILSLYKLNRPGVFKSL